MQEQSWDDAFSTHNFSDKHKDIMRNLGIRYECLDVWDDFHAQLNKGDIDITVLWEDPDVQAMQDMDEMMSGDNVNIVQDDCNIEHHVHDFSNELGKRKKAQTYLMSKMRATLQDLGWTENIPELLNQVVHVRHPPPEVQHNGAAWKTVVAQKQTEVLQLYLQNMPENSNSKTIHGTANNQFVPDNVCVVKKSYLSSLFVSKEWQATIEDIYILFGLNQEQGCAFCIVVNHACDPDSEQLKMYIGGMAGTGKSQVLRALSEFFSQRKELYRLLILAPMGSAAALLGGSTYHSVLGINSDGDHLSNTLLSQLKSKLLGVQYIFLDEVSMLSCREMYLISARLARILNNPDTLFSGMNMIFTGDFAQLLPAIGGEHTSPYS